VILYQVQPVTWGALAFVILWGFLIELITTVGFKLKRENDKGKMVRPWVEVEKDQYERLKELEENTGKRVSEMIREDVRLT